MQEKPNKHLYVSEETHRLVKLLAAAEQKNMSDLIGEWAREKSQKLGIKV